MVYYLIDVDDIDFTANEHNTYNQVFFLPKTLKGF